MCNLRPQVNTTESTISAIIHYVCIKSTDFMDIVRNEFDLNVMLLDLKESRIAIDKKVYENNLVDTKVSYMDYYLLYLLYTFCSRNYKDYRRRLEAVCTSLLGKSAITDIPRTLRIKGDSAGEPVDYSKDSLSFYKNLCLGSNMETEKTFIPKVLFKGTNELTNNFFSLLNEFIKKYDSDRVNITDMLTTLTLLATNQLNKINISSKLTSNLVNNFENTEEVDFAMKLVTRDRRLAEEEDYTPKLKQNLIKIIESNSKIITNDLIGMCGNVLYHLLESVILRETYNGINSIVTEDFSKYSGIFYLSKLVNTLERIGSNLITYNEKIKTWEITCNQVEFTNLIINVSSSQSVMDINSINRYHALKFLKQFSNGYTQKVIKTVTEKVTDSVEKDSISLDGVRVYKQKLEDCKVQLSEKYKEVEQLKARINKLQEENNIVKEEFNTLLDMTFIPDEETIESESNEVNYDALYALDIVVLTNSREYRNYLEVNFPHIKTISLSSVNFDTVPLKIADLVLFDILGTHHTHYYRALNNTTSGVLELNKYKSVQNKMRRLVECANRVLDKKLKVN